MNFKKFLLTQILLIFILCGFVPMGFTTPYALNALDPFYGAKIDMNGQLIQESMAQAAEAHLVWIAVDVNWQETWKDSEEPLANPRLDEVMQLAADSKMKVLVSITHAPNWALLPSGPDPYLTAKLIKLLIVKYPPIAAVEIFPGPNTVSGWGASPNPGAYLATLKTSQREINRSFRPIQLVAGGFVPVENSAADIDESEFLQTLYDLNGQSLLQIISIQYPSIQGEPNSHPSDRLPDVLRRYEHIRTVMLQNDHQAGLIWITSFSWPQRNSSTTKENARWLKEAYQYIYSHLYIEGIIYNSLNPNANGQNSLIQYDGSLHPAFSYLRLLFNGGMVDTVSR